MYTVHLNQYLHLTSAVTSHDSLSTTSHNLQSYVKCHNNYYNNDDDDDDDDDDDGDGDDDDGVMMR